MRLSFNRRGHAIVAFSAAPFRVKRRPERFGSTAVRVAASLL